MRPAADGVSPGDCLGEPRPGEIQCNGIECPAALAHEPNDIGGAVAGSPQSGNTTPGFAERD